MATCLIVDDVEVTRFTCEQIITAIGLKALSAETEESALKVLKETLVDIVFLDWHLRKTTSEELLKRIKKESSSRIKVIVISGVEGADKKNEIMKAGADAFLEKPTTKEKIKNCLAGLGLI